MTVRTTFLAALAAVALAIPAYAGGIMVEDSYARSSSKSAMSGAAFMIISNHGDSDDRLIAAESDVAKRVELHTHIETADGVMQMTEIEGGIALPAGASHSLKRGGDHVMFMGLNAPMVDGETLTVKLIFEHADPVVIEIPVDQTRAPGEGMMHKMQPKTNG